jgi:VWFA-related protein
MRRILIAVTLTAIGAAAQQDTIRSQSRLVQAWAAVESSRELSPEDFRLRVDGKPYPIQSVDTFNTGVAPVALAVAVETAGMSATALLKVRKVGAMVQAILTGERGRVAVLSFDSQVRLMQDFTGSPELISRAFDALRPAADPKRARMLDAVNEAASLLGRRERNRRVLLLISETKDRGSDIALEAALAAAHRAGVQVFAMTYSAWVTPWTTKASEQPRSGGLDILGGIGELIRAGKESSTAALVAATGGRGFTFARLAALEKAIDTLAEEFRSQYVVSFSPPPDAEPGTWHRIELDIRGVDARGVRARPGFIN